MIGDTTADIVDKKRIPVSNVSIQHHEVSPMALHCYARAGGKTKLLGQFAVIHSTLNYHHSCEDKRRSTRDLGHFLYIRWPCSHFLSYQFFAVPFLCIFIWNK
ncbi:hypothetical protein L6164_029020 [Bauhinia variegata]|uniref:Uncharacterized protein n=1 Tax=Bauhinia variegata TaxID=167791 RepID=A0ACB9L9A1_BAUVA|nr:hypothetical protein L6164_029020 [Bauhinia variegata]